MGVKEFDKIQKIDPYANQHPVVHNPPQTPEEKQRARDRLAEVRLRQLYGIRYTR